MVRTRKRLILACDHCRARRTKCDGQKPSCNPCRARGLDCLYQELPPSPETKVDSELASINMRLDYITNILAKQHNPPLEARLPGNRVLGSHEDSPFRLLATRSIMQVLGLEEEFAQNLIQLERANLLVPSTSGGPRLFFISHQQATNALAAFSEHVHAFYPVLPLDFSEQYFQILAEPLAPSCQSCLVLLVAAIGCVAVEPASGGPYLEAALTSLPLVLAECSLISIQCLLFLSIYHCCLLKPCQAHDYCLTASFKIQNLFKSGLQSTDPDILELTHRAYWGILLLESELSVQLDVAKSDIWTLDDYIPLPNCCRTWQFPPQAPLPPIAFANHSPASVQSNDSNSVDQAQSFFLAEVAMRRMLHRCNSAVTQLPDGRSTYAPGIALELERQLDEWYNYLPHSIRFTKDTDRLYSSNHTLGMLPNFLRVQYYCCRLSIYWPAVYQVMQDGVSSNQLMDHCQRFIDSYVQLMWSLEPAILDCLIYRWTLFLSFFITTLAGLKIAETPSFINASLDQLRQCLSSVPTADWTVAESSPSLKTLYYALSQLLQEAKISSVGERTHR